MTPFDTRSLGGVLGRAQGKKIVVIGDLIADEYVFGETSRVSREAPVLILRHLGQQVIPGGAGNAVLNLQTLGAEPRPVGLLGDGDLGRGVHEAFVARGIDAAGVLRDAERVTVRKTRVMAGGLHGQKQQILRIDQDDPSPVAGALAERLLTACDEALRGADGVLLSDYGYGTLGDPLRTEVLARVIASGLPVCADSRYELAAFRGVTYATPNEDEAAAAWGAPIRREADLRAASEKLRADLDAEFLLLTRGHEGMAVAERGGEFAEVPIWGSAEAADTTGAGDTVAATSLLALVAGASPVEAARLATIAAGIVVQQHGAATTTTEEIERVAGIDAHRNA